MEQGGCDGSSSPLLSLPEHVRFFIYEFAGLPMKDTVVVRTRNCSHLSLTRDFIVGSSQDGPVYTSTLSTTAILLRTCRLIYEELSVFLYSHNQFVVQVHENKDLQFLNNLRPCTIKNLTNLAVLWHLISPINHLESMRNLREYVGHGTIAPARSLFESPNQVKAHIIQSALFGRWNEVLGRIAKYLLPQRLTLSLRCHTTCEKAAEAIAAPFSKLEHHLAQCSIVFGYHRNKKMARLAQKAVFCAVSGTRDEPASSFNYLKLPVELRLQVLEYTDLVLPTRNAEWDPQDGFCHRWPISPNDATSYVLQFRSCCGDNHTTSFKKSLHSWCHGPFKGQGGPRCFCSQRHSAFNSRGGQCYCWTSPESLFLVCRVMRDDAEQVFFTKNRITVFPFPISSPNSLADPRDVMGVSAFFDGLRPSALKALRQIEIVLPMFHVEEHFRPEDKILRDWISTLERAGHHFADSSLMIRIYAIDYYEDPLNTRLKLRREPDPVVVQSYINALQSFSEFNHLKNFFLHLTWPFKWGDSFHNHGGWRWDQLKKYPDPKSDEFSAELGGEIMGKERYKRLSAGEEAYPQSEWYLLAWKKEIH